MSNPYQSPSGFDVPPQKFAPQKWARNNVDYSEAFNFAFANPNYLVNCILLGVGGMIPILGPILTLGYFYDDYIQQLRDGRPSPSDVKIEKFMDYLQRGVMPFLATLLVGLVLGMLIAVVVIPVVVLFFIVARQSEEAAGLGMMGFQLGMIPFQVVAGMIIAPSVLRVGISGKFEEITNYKWALSMVKVVWPQIILGAFISYFVSMIGGTIGILLCCVGIIPVVGFIGYFNFHLQRQWYEIYVTKGGEPIPVSVETFKL